MRHDVDRYSYRVCWSDPDDSFMADVVELQGVIAFGGTAEDALRNARDVAGIWLDDAAATGEPLPPALGHLAWATRELMDLTVEPVTGEDIRIIRRNLGLTQQAFAELLGVALNTVQAWEQGINAPSGAGQHLVRLIEAVAKSDQAPRQVREAAAAAS